MKLSSLPTSNLKLKQHFKSLNYYSMPNSTLFVFRKRVHFFLTATLTIALFFVTIF